MMSDNHIDNFSVNSKFSDEDEVFISPQKLCGRVLIAEDDLASQRLLDAYLGRLGIDITMVNNGKEVVEQAQNYYFDMILMDVQMPVMDGVEAAKILRSSSYSQPIVALTANVHEDHRQSCMEAGFNEFLTKPIDLQRLYSALEQYIRKSKRKTHIPENEAQIVSSLLESDPDLVDLIDRYVSSLPEKIEQLRHAADCESWQTLIDLAHDLNGISGNYGFPSVSELAATLESQLISQEYGDIDKCIQKLQVLQTRVVVSKAG